MMPPPRTVEITPHTLIGVSLAVLGVVLTLDNLGFVEAQEVLKFWPIVPMLVGCVYIVQGHETRDWVVGAGWLAVGTAFLLRNLGVFKFRLSDFVPLILVAIGLRFMFGRVRPKRRWPGTSDPAQPPPVPGVPTGFGPMGDLGFPPRFDAPPAGGPAAAGAWTGARSGNESPHVLRLFAILWGTDRRHHGPLAHVEVSAVMGGCDVDLRDATPTSDPLVIQVFAMWGGIDIRVPPGWLVQNEAWPISAASSTAPRRRPCRPTA